MPAAALLHGDSEIASCAASRRKKNRIKKDRHTQKIEEVNEGYILYLLVSNTEKDRHTQKRIHEILEIFFVLC